MKKIYFGLLLIGCMVFNNCRANSIIIQNPDPLCNPIYTNTFATISCGDSVSFNGSFYHLSGSYSDTLLNSQGCDSIVTLHLAAIGDTITQSSGLCAGDSFYFYGRYLYSQGNYDTVVPGQSGCDTMVNLSLVIVGSSLPNHIYDTICRGDSIKFNGSYVDTSGSYTAHFTSQYGCDSIVILELDVVTQQLSYTATLCAGDSFYFYGRYIYTQGNYDTFVSGHGACDTLISLTLVAGQAVPPTYVHDTICYGDSLTVNGSVFDSSGAYSIYYNSQNGCDSLVILQLVVQQSPVSFSWDSLLGTGALYCCDVFNNLVDTVWYLYDPLNALTLVGGSPPGGIYQGFGVVNNILYADSLYDNGSYADSYNGFDTITYSVSVNGCIASASDILEAFVNVGIKPLNIESSVLLYPNPVNDMLVLQSYWFTANNVTPVLYEVTGKEIAVTDFTREQDKITLNTGSLSAGIYFIKLSIEGNQVVKKFVKVE